MDRRTVKPARRKVKLLKEEIFWGRRQLTKTLKKKQQTVTTDSDRKLIQSQELTALIKAKWEKLQKMKGPAELKVPKGQRQAELQSQQQQLQPPITTGTHFPIKTEPEQPECPPQPFGGITTLHHSNILSSLLQKAPAAQVNEEILDVAVKSEPEASVAKLFEENNDQERGEEDILVKQESQKLDSLDFVFLDLAKRVRGLSSKRQLSVKCKLSKIIADAEFDEMEERQHEKYQK